MSWNEVPGPSCKTSRAGSKQYNMVWAEMGLSTHSFKYGASTHWLFSAEGDAESSRNWKASLISPERGHETILWELSSCFPEERNILISKAWKTGGLWVTVLAKFPRSPPLDRTLFVMSQSLELFIPCQAKTTQHMPLFPWKFPKLCRIYHL